MSVIGFLFYGLLETEKNSFAGLICCIVFGLSGFIPYLVHKILVRRREHFNLPISNLILVLNVLSGIWLLFLSPCRDLPSEPTNRCIPGRDENEFSRTGKVGQSVRLPRETHVMQSFPERPSADYNG